MTVLYRHLKPCGEVFYIGIGNSKRPYSRKSRNNFWKKIVNKNGYEIDILKRDLTFEEACDLEKILISYYGRRDLGLGTLCNLTDGGEGNNNPSEETREKMRNANKGTGGETHHYYGKPKTEEQKQKIREAKIGKKFSEEHKQKLREGAANHKERMPIKYICIKTLETFKTIIDCAKYLNISYGTLKSYLDKNIKLKNTTTIVLYEDYIKGEYEQPHIKRQKTLK